MKYTTLFAVIIGLLSMGCKKQESIPYEGQTYTVEGYYVSRAEQSPKVGKLVILSEGKDFQTYDPVMTDSNGYFKITYSSKTSAKYINLHTYLADYSCATPDVYILQNLPKGQNLKLGKVVKGNQ